MHKLALVAIYSATLGLLLSMDWQGQQHQQQTVQTEAAPTVEAQSTPQTTEASCDPSLQTCAAAQQKAERLTKSALTRTTFSEPAEKQTAATQ
ncbi:MAG: hypothetical protein ACPGSC_07760 [Granulosicoccaceae bacterium]